MRITWGWGRKEQVVRWDARLTLSEGVITRVDPCFSGPPVVAPNHQIGDAEAPDAEDLPHALTQQKERFCYWRSATSGNITLRHPTTQALSLKLQAPLNARLMLAVNGQRYEYSLVELAYAGRCHYLRGWLSEAIQIGRLVPAAECSLEAEFTDAPEHEVDCYRLRVAQANGQWAWLTPIWVEK